MISCAAVRWAADAGKGFGGPRRVQPPPPASKPPLGVVRLALPPAGSEAGASTISIPCSISTSAPEKESTPSLEAKPIGKDSTPASGFTAATAAPVTVVSGHPPTAEATALANAVTLEETTSAAAPSAAPSRSSATSTSMLTAGDTTSLGFPTVAPPSDTLSTESSADGCGGSSALVEQLILAPVSTVVEVAVSTVVEVAGVLSALPEDGTWVYVSCGSFNGGGGGGWVGREEGKGAFVVVPVCDRSDVLPYCPLVEMTCLICL
jgi:hypothetical protein